MDIEFFDGLQYEPETGAGGADLGAELETGAAVAGPELNASKVIGIAASSVAGNDAKMTGTAAALKDAAGGVVGPVGMLSNASDIVAKPPETAALTAMSFFLICMYSGACATCT